MSEEQQEAIAKKQIQKMEQEALKSEIDDLFNKIVSGDAPGAKTGKLSKSSQRSSSKNSQISKKSKK